MNANNHPGQPMSTDDDIRTIIRLRGEDYNEDADADTDADGWIIDGVDGYDPPFGTGTTWDTAEDAMAEHPGKWWLDEPGCWLCYAEDLDDQATPSTQDSP